MRAVRVRQRDVPDGRRRAADPLQVLDQHVRVAVEEGVHERQLAAGVEEEGVHVAAFGLPDAVKAWRDLHRDRQAGAATLRHGQKALSTPRIAGASSGKCLSSTVSMLLSSSQLKPAGV